MGYIIGFTPGTYEVARTGGVQAAREFSGLERKIASAVTAGANFVQVDMEHLGEWFSPLLLQKLERILKEMNMDWALHAEVITYYAHLDDPRRTAWKLDNFRLHRYFDRLYELFILKGKLEIFPRYFLIHASAREVVGYYVYKEMPAQDITIPPIGYRVKKNLNDYIGEIITWDEFFDESKEYPYYAYDKEARKRLKKWFESKVTPLLIIRTLPLLEELKRMTISELVGTLSEELAEKVSEKIADEFVKRGKIREEEKEKIKNLLKRFFSASKERERIRETLRLHFLPLPQELRGSIEFIENNFLPFLSAISNIYVEEKEVQENFKKFFTSLYNYWRDEVSRRVGEKAAIPYEDIALAIVSQYLYFSREKEKIWKIFFKEKSIEEILKIDTTSDEVINLERGVTLNPKLNAICAARYIISHFESLPLEDYVSEMERYLSTANLTEEEKKKLREFSRKSLFEKLKIINDELKKVGRKFYFVFENPEARTPLEGINRIAHLDDLYYLAKSANEYAKMFLKDESFDYFRACIDTDHLISQGFDPEREIISLPEDAGKYFMVFHIGSPTGEHSHEPLELGSDEQFLIYRYCYMLRKKGFGKDENAYLIFERGGGRTPFEFLRTTILSLRKIAEYLMKDVDPDKLDEGFIGWSETSPDFIRQREIIRLHALEPLKETLIVPPEEHTYLGRFATEERRVRPDTWKKEELK